ncbi:hypothetical protein D3C81_530440 [compost metagenome]
MVSQQIPLLIELFYLQRGVLSGLQVSALLQRVSAPVNIARVYFATVIRRGGRKLQILQRVEHAGQLRVLRNLELHVLFGLGAGAGGRQQFFCLYRQAKFTGKQPAEPYIIGVEGDIAVAQQR